MKERPILMNGEMVRATLRNINPKRETRRVIKLKPGQGMYSLDEFIDVPRDAGVWPGQITEDGLERMWPIYGKVGDRLWVRETTWWGFDGLDGEDFLGYVADGIIPVASQHLEAFTSPKVFKLPSIFMPKNRRRITLEITNIRIERLQDISEKDAFAEGIIQNRDGTFKCSDNSNSHHFLKQPHLTARGAYITLWDSINSKKYPWHSNPFVWVIEFKRI